MKKTLFLTILLGWASPIFAQLPLVSAYRNERIGKDYDNVTPRDWQNFFRPNFTQFLVSREGRLATSGGAVGEVLYYYRDSAPGAGHRPLRKPIIVLDGFDPLDRRSREELDLLQIIYSRSKICVPSPWGGPGRG
jgi:hypothetical protein